MQQRDLDRPRLSFADRAYLDALVLAVAAVTNTRGEERPVTPTEVAALADRPVPTVCRALRKLSDMGVVEQCARGLYRPTALGRDLAAA